MVGIHIPIVYPNIHIYTPLFFLTAPKSEKSKKVKKEKDPSKSLDEVRLDPELLRAANKVAQEKFK